MSLNILNEMNGKMCECGKLHTMPVKKVLVGKGVINTLPELIEENNSRKPFIISDINTYKVAGEELCKILENSHIKYTSFVINELEPVPDEKTVGKVILNYDSTCDIIIGVGSGVINDIAKIISTVASKPYIIVGTAPSMDGYASSLSSMIRDGMKVSIPSKMADIIIGDTDILRTAPDRMLLAGLGDMIAKYVSLCEWQISSVINGEYYCDKIAHLVRTALERCVNNAQGLLKRDDEAIEAVFEGLVIGGAAMTYAGLSRPASGVEHYMSHVWDMRGVEFGEHIDLHGTQCAVGSLIAIKLYNELAQITPDKEKALNYVSDFSYDEWGKTLKGFLGNGADAMIKLESTEGKYDKEKHRIRLQTIIDNWEKIAEIINDKIPDYNTVYKLYKSIGMPESLKDIGIDETLAPITFLATKDIRNKYILSHLAWDLGIVDEMAESLK